MAYWAVAGQLLHTPGLRFIPTMHLELILLLVCTGLFTGFAAGLLGIGGGMLLVPFFTFIFTLQQFPADHLVHMAIATSLTTILFTSMSSVYAHHRKGSVIWKAAFMLIPGILIGAWIGPTLAAMMDTRVLAGFFGIFVTASALQMLLSKPPEQAGTLPGIPGMFAAGTGIGTLSGLVGAGGGFVTVPFLTWRGVPIHKAVGTSAVMGFPIALSGTLSNIYNGWGLPDLPSGSLGYVYLPGLFSVVVSSMLTAPLGARTAHKLNVRQLKRVFAYVLFLLAGYMIWTALKS